MFHARSARAQRSVRPVTLETLESRTLLSAAPAADASFGPLGAAGPQTFGNGAVARYDDALTGQSVLVRLTGPGTGTVTTGATTDDFLMTLDGTTAATTLTFTTLAAVIGAVQVNGSLGSVRAKTVTLADTFNLTGSIDNVQLGGATSGARIDAAVANAPLRMTLGIIQDLNVTTPAPVASVKVIDWINVDAQFDVITTPSVGTIKSARNFRAGINTTGSVGSVKVGQDLAGIWDVSGNVGTVAARTALVGWTVNVGGHLSSLKVVNLSATMELGSVGTVNVAGAYTDGSFTAFGFVNAFTVRQHLGSTTVTVSDGIGKMSLGSALEATIYIGVDSSSFLLPSDPGEFVIEGSRIGSFSVKEVFANTKVAASTLGKVAIRTIVPQNGGNTFGFATISLDSFTGAGIKWRAGQDTTQLTTPQGDFVVRLLG